MPGAAELVHNLPVRRILLTGLPPLEVLDLAGPLEVFCKSSPYPVPARRAEACLRTSCYRVVEDGSVAVPGAASAASVAASRYACGSTPASFADSQSV